MPTGSSNTRSATSGPTKPDQILQTVAVRPSAEHEQTLAEIAEVPPVLRLLRQIGRFVAVVLALGWALRQLQVQWPRWAEPLPAYAIGTVAAFWLIERTSGFFAIS